MRGEAFQNKQSNPQAERLPLWHEAEVGFHTVAVLESGALSLAKQASWPCIQLGF